METERITLSQRERDRLRVLHEVQQRHVTQVAAAARLKVTDRQVRRMLAPHPRTQGCGSDSRITRTAIESQAGSPFRGEGFDSRGSALCRLWAHAGRRALSPGWFPREPGDPADLDDQSGLLASALPAGEEDPRVAGKKS